MSAHGAGLAALAGHWCYAAIADIMAGLMGHAHREQEQVQQQDQQQQPAPVQHQYGPGPATSFTRGGQGVVFYPSAGLQRYGAACDLLASRLYFKEGPPTKVVDLGCGELQLFKHLKHIPGINHIVAVDYDEDLLKQKHKIVEPFVYDNVVKRTEPLEVEILQGNACEPDCRLLDADAVICIEMIEHLDPGVLDRLIHNIFGYIKPRVAFITTPNSDFNVLFENLRNGGFRHYDHRFEWSREQFEDWSNNILVRYPDYDVQFAGIAEGPKGTEHLGCCSQSALFIKKEAGSDLTRQIPTKIETDAEGSCDPKKHDLPTNSLSKSSCDSKKYRIDTKTENERTEEKKYLFDNINWEIGPTEMPYKLIMNYSYPYEVNKRTDDEQLLHIAEDRINICRYRRNAEDEDGNIKIPIVELLTPGKEFDDSIVGHLKNLLIAKNYEIEGDCLVFRYQQYFSTGESEFSDHFETECPATNIVAVQQEDNWDTEIPTTSTSVFWPCEDQNTDPPLVNSVSNDILYDSLTPEGRGSTSPLANFFSRTGGPDDEHKLSDSGYTKSQSQDSPQSPVCSDTFSNDLITPDRDFSDMTPANILECIPENLNCLTTPKEGTRRRSIGHGINLASSSSCEFQAEHVSGRPKSLQVFKSSDSYNSEDRIVWDTPSEVKDSPLIPDLSPDGEDGNLFVNHMRPLDFLLEEPRVLRPDFLDIQNLLGVQNRDRLNNNVDLEGNNVQGDDEVDEDRLIEEDNNIIENRIWLDEDEAILFQQHLDRHNENHLIALVGENNIPELPIDEDIVLEYQENVEEDGNNEFYDRPHAAEVLSPTDSSYKSEFPLDLSIADDLITSIEQTLSLEDPSNLDKDDIEQLRTELSDIDLKSNLYIGINPSFGLSAPSGSRPLFYVDSDNSLTGEQIHSQDDVEPSKKKSSVEESKEAVKFIL